MRVLNIRNDQEFIFEGMSFVIGSEGKRCLIVDYKANVGECILTIEGEAKAPSLNGREKISFAQFKRLFPKYRIYIKGYIDMGKDK